jgi:phosphoenolpyruvate-protein kinase (PTS system EI component)
VFSGVRAVFTATSPGARVAIDSDTGEVNINPSAAQAAALRR